MTGVQPGEQAALMSSVQGFQTAQGAFLRQAVHEGAGYIEYRTHTNGISQGILTFLLGAFGLLNAVDDGAPAPS
jgi:hypothetical protein